MFTQMLSLWRPWIPYGQCLIHLCVPSNTTFLPHGRHSIKVSWTNEHLNQLSLLHLSHQLIFLCLKCFQSSLSIRASWVNKYYEFPSTFHTEQVIGVKNRMQLFQAMIKSCLHMLYSWTHQFRSHNLLINCLLVQIYLCSLKCFFN